MKYRLIALVFIGVNHLGAMEPGAEKMVTIEQVKKELSLFIKNTPSPGFGDASIGPEERVIKALSQTTIGDDPIPLHFTIKYLEQLRRNPNRTMQERMQEYIKESIAKRLDQERAKLDNNKNKTILKSSC